MNKIKLFICIIFLISLFAYQNSFSWEKYDMVIAVVNNYPIAESEVFERFDNLKRRKKVPKSKYNYEISRVIDSFIEDQLVSEAAYDVSIVISDDRVIEHFEKLMKQYFQSKVKVKNVESLVIRLGKLLKNRREKKSPVIKDKKLEKKLDSFIKEMERSQKMKFNFIFENTRRQMQKEQVMSIAIGISPPSKQDCIKWFKKNKRKLGYEARVKHILIKPKSSSFAHEREANKKMSEIRKQIMSGQSFEKLAMKNSQDTGSAKKGGDLGWVMIASLDPYFAGNVDKMKRKGQISQVFKSNFGYHIVKYLGRRNVTYENVEGMIRYKLHMENLDQQFNDWVIRKKRNSDIKIYMKKYIKKKL